ncbi:MAG TPA: c-type cytochrome, partial [Verrucomicrobiae bacterium]|nr:c-type cytochrome [Verrucomicrobiae bacterium]
PWFRPVALELGPDGAMYMADFYNRIIGHYEVPLDNPGRDRERGRIWRISYTGKAAAAPAEPLAMPRDAAALVAELGNPNIDRRMLAMSEITDRIGKPAVGLLENVFQNPSANAFQKAHALWTLERLGALNENLLVREARDPSRDVRVHVMRIVGELASPTPAEMALAVTGATDSDAYVQRAAADALGRHPAFENIAALLKLRGTIPDADPELLHVTRIALRDNLAASNNFSRVIASDTAEADSRFIADVSVGIQTGDAAEFLMKHIQKFSEDRHHIEEYLQHVARFAPESRLGDLADFTRRKFAADLDFQVALFKSTGQGLAQRGVAMNEALTNWGAMLAEKMIAELDPDSFAWRNSSLKGGNAPNPWFVEAWPSADGNTTAPFLSSRDEGGGNATGILRSKPFVIPRQLSFYIAGYDGTPDRPIGKRSFFYLRSAKDDKILARARPPVKDIAQRVTWRLDRFAGQKGYLEIVDGNRGHTAAWLAVGRLDPAVVPMPSSIPSDLQKRQLLAAELAEQLRLTSLGPALAGLLRDQNRGEDLRMASAKALAAAEGESSVPELADVFSNSRNPEPLREGVAFLLAKINGAHARSVLSAGLAAAPFAAQRKIAAAMAANSQGAEALLETVERGKVSARVLRDNQVKERLEASLGGSAGTEASIRPVAIKNQPSSLDARLAKLTKDLEPISAEKQKLIDSRYQGFLSGHGSASRGAAVFNHNCSVCHSINSRGGNIGPQLDGVGNRGAARLAEDILDPNRNVDPAFFYSNVTLKDDTVVTGLFRREEGALLVFANSSGKEVSVPKSEITDQRVSKHSLMPDNFGDLISQSDFDDLVTFLLTKQRK